MLFVTSNNNNISRVLSREIRFLFSLSSSSFSPSASAFAVAFASAGRSLGRSVVHSLIRHERRRGDAAAAAPAVAVSLNSHRRQSSEGFPLTECTWTLPGDLCESSCPGRTCVRDPESGMSLFLCLSGEIIIKRAVCRVEYFPHRVSGPANER